MKLGDLAERYDERLRTGDFDDFDKSVNGIQVGDPEMSVKRAAYAVDAVQATIEAAVDADADVLCAHHGIIWGGLERVTGRTYDRVSTLIEHELALYAAHLPLDAHLELGNAAGVADLLELEHCEPFGEEGSETIGLRGRVADGPISTERLEGRLADGLGDLDPPVRTLAFGPDSVESVAVITGSGGDWIEAAAEAGLDALVTGEGSQSVYHRAREAGVTVLLGGHYATERFGVRRLQALADEWGLETTYIDWPTGF